MPQPIMAPPLGDRHGIRQLSRWLEGYHGIVASRELHQLYLIRKAMVRARNYSNQGMRLRSTNCDRSLNRFEKGSFDIREPNTGSHQQSVHLVNE